MDFAPFVDCHAHIFTRDLPTRNSTRHRLDYDFTAEDYLSVLDRHGVHFGVLAAASNYGDYNDYLLDCLRRHKRLRGTVIVKPEVELGVLQAMKRDGAVGIRLMFRGVPDQDLPDLTSFEYRRLFRRLRDIDWHVHLHCEGARSAPFVELLAATGVKLVIDHFGTPDRDAGTDTPGLQAVLRAAERGRTWVKLSAGFRIDKETAKTCADALIRRLGPERLVWGSDCPFASFEGTVDYESVVADFHDWVPDLRMRHVIGCETPLKLYFT